MIAMTTRSSISVNPKLARSHFARIAVSLCDTNDNLIKKSTRVSIRWWTIYNNLSTIGRRWPSRVTKRSLRCEASERRCSPRVRHNLLESGFLEFGKTPHCGKQITLAVHSDLLVGHYLPGSRRPSAHHYIRVLIPG